MDEQHRDDADYERILAQTPDPTVREAVKRIYANAAYHWLTRSSRQMWRVDDVHQALVAAGLSNLARGAVRAWFRQTPNLQHFSGPLGFQTTKDDLVRFFASRLINPAPAGPSDQPPAADG